MSDDPVLFSDSCLTDRRIKGHAEPALNEGVLIAGVAELCRCHSLPTPKGLGKVLGIVEAALIGNLLDGHRGIAQQVLSDTPALLLQ